MNARYFFISTYGFLDGDSIFDVLDDFVERHGIVGTNLPQDLAAEILSISFPELGQENWKEEHNDPQVVLRAWADFLHANPDLVY